jgi:hypothetical protein
MTKRKPQARKHASWKYPALILIGFVGFLVGVIFSALPIQAANLIQSASATRTTAQTNPTNVTATYPTPATTGRLLIAVVAANGDTTINGPSGWTQIIHESGTVSQAIYYKLAVGGESSISASVSANPGSIGLHIYEYAGANTLGSVTSNTGTSNAPSSGTIATSQTNELVFAAFVIRANTSYANASWNNAGEGFTERRDFNTGTGARVAGYAGGDNLTNTAGNKSVTVATGSSAAWRGQIVSFQMITPDTTPPTAVGNLTASNPTNSSIDLAWTAPGDDGDTGTASVYDIRYSVSPITDENFASATQVTDEPNPLIAGTSQSMTVIGLSPNTNYYFAIKTADEASNTSALSNVPTLTTADGPAEDSEDTPVNLYPENLIVRILPEECTTDRKVKLLLHAHNATYVKISNLPDLSDASWEPFEPGEDRFAYVNWTISEDDGDKTIYVLFRSPFYDLLSEIETASVRLDQKALCQTSEEHEHIIDTKGNLRALEVQEACISDFAHAVIQPYVTGTNAFVTQLSGTETEYRFTDAGNETVIIVKKTEPSKINLRIEKRQGDKPHDIRLRILADDLGEVYDALLWHAVSGFRELPKVIDLTTIPQLCASELVPHPHPGDLFRGPSTNIYLMGRDGKRHAFPNDEVFKSWFQTTTQVMTIAGYQLTRIPLGENVTLRPGLLVRVMDGLVVYLTDLGRQLRQVITTALTESLKTRVGNAVYILDPALVTNYILGNPILSEDDPATALLKSATTTVDELWPSSDAHETLMRALEIRDGRLILENGPYKRGEAELRFRILSKDGKPMTGKDLKISHEMEIHLLIAREDLGEFQHLHPQETDGLWAVRAQFDKEGHYYLYADIVPVGESPIILRAPVAIGDNPLDNTAFPVPDPNQAGNLNPYRLELLTKEVHARKEALLTFQLTKDGKPVQEIQPWLETYAHLVIFKQGNWNTYFHTHPLKDHRPSNGELIFITRFPYSGRYTMFAQIKVDDQVRTFPITIDVPASEE